MKAIYRSAIIGSSLIFAATVAASNVQSPSGSTFESPAPSPEIFSPSPSLSILPTATPVTPPMEPSSSPTPDNTPIPNPTPSPTPEPTPPTPFVTTSFGCKLPQGNMTIRGVEIIKDVQKGEVIGNVTNKAATYNDNPLLTVRYSDELNTYNARDKFPELEGFTVLDNESSSLSQVFTAPEGTPIKSLTDGTLVYKGTVGGVRGKAGQIVVLNEECRYVIYENAE